MLTRWPNRGARRTARRAPRHPSRPLERRRSSSTSSPRSPSRRRRSPGPGPPREDRAPCCGCRPSGAHRCRASPSSGCSSGSSACSRRSDSRSSWSGCRGRQSPSSTRADSCGRAPTRSAARRRIGVLVVVVALPVTFDPGTAERFAVAKLTLLMVGALVLAVLWLVDAFTSTELPDLRTGLHWPILAMVARRRPGDDPQCRTLASASSAPISRTTACSRSFRSQSSRSPPPRRGGPVICARS